MLREGLRITPERAVSVLAIILLAFAVAFSMSGWVACERYWTNDFSFFPEGRYYWWFPLVGIGLAALCSAVCGLGLLRRKGWALKGADLLVGIMYGLFLSRLITLGPRSIAVSSLGTVVAYVTVSILCDLSAIRAVCGLRPVQRRERIKGAVVLVVALTLAAAVIAVMVHRWTTPEARKFEPSSFEQLVGSLAGKQLPTCRVVLESGFCIPAAFVLEDYQESRWRYRSPEGSMLDLSDAGNLYQDVPGIFGYGSQYEFERAVWHAHYLPLFLVMKQIQFRGVEVYDINHRAVSGIVQLGHNSESDRWWIQSNLYPKGSRPLSVLIWASTREDAIGWLLAAVQSYKEKDHK